MSKKSRKFKRAAAVAAERKSALGLKKKEGKVKKEALLKALSEKSVSTITSPINAPGGRKKRRHKKKAANSKSGCEHMVIGHDVNETHSRKQTKDNSAAMGATGKRKKKRKRSGKGRAPSEPPSEDKRPSESVIPVPKSNGITEASGKLRKRRKRRASLEVANAPELLMSVNPSKKVRLEEALSESEPELINADWGLADDSSEKGSGNSKADLDTSEDDVDEEPPHSDGDTDGSDINEKLKDSQCVDSSKNSDVGNPGKEESGGNQQDVEIQACRPVKKKFSLLDRAAILKEMQDRIAEFDSRCLYVAPIPGDCTFDLLKKFIPEMKSCRFFTRPKSNKLRTFVFVEFANAETANREKLSISGRLFAGQSMRAEVRSNHLYGGNRIMNGVYNPDDIDFLRILVTGLPPGVKQADLKNVFPTAENIRLPMSPRNFNYGYAILNYVSDAVALDAFSQCHKILLEGHPISVNFAFKTPENKLPASTATTSSTKPSVPIESQDGTQPPQRVGNVVIQTMVNAKDAEEDRLTSIKTSASLELIKDQQPHVQNLSTKEGKSEDEGSEEKSTFIFEMIKQAKQIDERTTELKSGGNNEGPDDDEEMGGDSVEEESNDDGESDDVDEHESDEEDKVEEVNASPSALDSGESEADEMDATAGNDSEGEAIDASLVEVLKTRRACEKALKSPGAKRNWRTTVGTERAGTVPKVLVVPKRNRK